jgi:hypothetical protein
VNCPFDSRAKGVAEPVAVAEFSDLNQLTNDFYMYYLKRELWKWYYKAQRPTHKQPAVNEEEIAPAANNH